MKELRVKFVWLLLFVAIITGSVYFFNVFDVQKYSPMPTPIPQENAVVAAFAASNSQNFLTYKDVEYGFSVKYPIGFYAEKDSLGEAAVSFKAVLSEDLFELLRVDVFNQTLSKQDVEGIVTGLQSQMKLLGRKTIELNGKQVELLELEARNPVLAEEKIFVYQGIFPQCSGGYSAIASAAITERLPQDESLALYFIYSFEC